MITQKRLGIIGGLGSETSCSFCLSVNNKVRGLTGCQPDIVMENLPVSIEAETKIIRAELNEDHFNLLTKAVKRLNRAEVDFIVVPCNTVHTFLEQLRSISEVPILSIIEETVRECVKKSFKKVALLASTKTVKEELFLKELEKETIGLELPSLEDQLLVTEIILKILAGEADKKDKEFLLRLILEFKQRGAEAVILGCTDLPLLITSEDCDLPLINSCQALENASIRCLVEKPQQIFLSKPLNKSHTFM